MKRIAFVIILLTLSVTAADKKPSLFEQMTQSKVTFQTDFLSDANFEGFDVNERDSYSIGSSAGVIVKLRYNF